MKKIFLSFFVFVFVLEAVPLWRVLFVQVENIDIEYFHGYPHKTNLSADDLVFIKSAALDAISFLNSSAKNKVKFQAHFLNIKTPVKSMSGYYSGEFYVSCKDLPKEALPLLKNYNLIMLNAKYITANRRSAGNHSHGLTFTSKAKNKEVLATYSSVVLPQKSVKYLSYVYIHEFLHSLIYAANASGAAMLNLHRPDRYRYADTLDDNLEFYKNILAGNITDLKGLWDYPLNSNFKCY